MGNSDKSACERLQKWREAVHVLINKMLVETRLEEQQEQWKGSWWEADMSLWDHFFTLKLKDSCWIGNCRDFTAEQNKKKATQTKNLGWIPRQNIHLWNNAEEIVESPGL